MTSKTVAVVEGDDASPAAVRPVIALLDSLNLGSRWTYPPQGADAETGAASAKAAIAAVARVLA